MVKIKCDCGRIIDLKGGEQQVEYFGSGEDDTEEYGKCKFCGKIFK